ncbi:MAG: hypothetical protein HUJ97_10260 [Bacteroidales bacterium]|nr:hypothetical protein [Bacteroidales bacterium]
MKKLLCTIIMALTIASLCDAQPPGWKMPKREKKIYSLSVGQVKMDIDANCGGRIVSLKHDTTEIISQIEFPNMFGSTFWTSPQKEWNWPPVREHDTMPYTVEEKDGALVMTSPLSEKLPIRIIKKFEANEQENCFVVTYSMINEAKEEKKVAPWEITRVLSRGSVLFDAPVEGIWPAGLMPFEQKNGYAWFDINHDETQNRKVNSDGKGWLAYIDKGLLLIKRFEDITPEQPAPGEAEIQVYVHQGNVYVELESQGAYVTLQPGERTDWAVKWYLMPYTNLDVLK